MNKKLIKSILSGWEPPIAIHPGEHIRDFLKDTNMSQAELAERVGVSKKEINEIIKEKRGVTKKTATGLGKVFSISPEFWINLQSNYDSLLAKHNQFT